MLADDATFDDFYKVPVITGEIGPDLFAPPGESATYAVRIPGGPLLRFATRIVPGTVLRVVFHGAVVRTRDRYPRYDRISTSVRAGQSFVSFADPTVAINDTLTLGWFTGTQAWDPTQTILDVIAAVAGAGEAPQTVLLGGSGGGYASLRFSAMIPGSHAFVFSPQTSVAKYRGGHFSALLEAAYGISGEGAASQAYEQHPGRFEVLSTYEEPTLNRVYYLQNINDPFHIVDHYNPFRRAVGVTRAEGASRDGQHTLVLADLDQVGHGPPTPAEFDVHWAEALRLWGW